MTINDLIHWNRPQNVSVQKRGRFGQSLSSLHDEMDRMFHDFFSDVELPTWAKEANYPSVDIVEKGENFNITAELAGMDPEDIEVSITDGFLTIKGEKEDKKEEKDNNYLRRETSYGSFQRTISLPETANCDQAEANFKNGILKIDVPKKAEAIQKPKKLQIKKAA